MALGIGDNFKYQGKKPNFERDTFATKAAMKAFPEASIDEGHISFCAEDGKHYEYRSGNPVDATTGKWKLYLGDYALKDEVTSHITEYNVSVHHPTSGIGGTNKFTLAEAIKLIPQDLRRVGIKCSFLDGAEKIACHEYQGGAWEDVKSWVKVDGAVVTDMLSTQGTLQAEQQQHGTKIASLEKNLTAVATQEITTERLSAATKQYIEAAGGGTITNNADDEDLEVVQQNGLSVLKLKDKAYDAAAFSGKGRKILRKNIVRGKNILTEQMLSNENTIYHIQYDYDLNGLTVRIPANSTLFFDGGSFRNGIILGNNTYINSVSNYTLFYDVQFELNSTFTNQWYAEWFGASTKRKDNDVPFNYALQQLKKCRGSSVLYITDTYTTADTIYLVEKVSLKGSSRNMHYNMVVPKENTGCAIKADFINKNKWIFDTETNGVAVPYNAVTMDNFSNSSRKAGLVFADFDVFSVSPIFGAIRIISVFNCKFSNIAIYGTWKGILTANAWCNIFENLWIEAYYNAVHMSVDSTTSVWIAPHFLYPLYGEKNVSFDKPLVYPDKSLPPYTDVNTPAIIMEGKQMADYAKAIMINPVIEHYSAVAIGDRFELNLSRPYLESRKEYDTIVWGYDANVKVEGCEGATVSCRLNSYHFGTFRGDFQLIDFPFNRCYDPYDSNVPFSSFYKYLVDARKSRKGYYYDKIILNPDGTFLRGEKTKNKYLINGYDYLRLSQSQSVDFEWDKLNFGQSVDWDEMLKRCYDESEINVELINYITYECKEYINNKIVNFVFPLPIKDSYPKFFKISSTLRLRNSTLRFKKGNGFSFVTGVLPFEVKGALKIFDGGAYLEVPIATKVFKLVGEEDIHIVWENANQYIVFSNQNIDISEFKRSYEITIIKSDGKVIQLTNKKGPTENRPNYVLKGFEYFDTILNKPIWKKTDTGTEWVDATGATI